MKQKFTTRLLTLVTNLYIFSWLLFVPYYNWTYANDNGFVKWLLLGEVVATGKGIIWPYFFFFDKPKENNVTHFINSMKYQNDATKLINQGQDFAPTNDSDMKKIMELKRKAFDEAKMVNIEKLNNIHPNFGNHFRDEYIKGLQLFIYGYDKHQDQDFIQAQILMDNWVDWYYSNINIKSKNKIEVQVKSPNTSSKPEEPKLNSSELDRYSRVLKKANEEVLNQTDLDELRSVISDYTTRTARKITKSEYDNFIGLIKLSDDYMYELGTSLLYSWDQKKIITTNKFNELYQTMKMTKIRKEQKLIVDMSSLKAAAANQHFVEIQTGQKYEFNREIILEHIKQNEISNANMNKIEAMMKEFVE
jgi:hypothetical protein